MIIIFRGIFYYLAAFFGTLQEIYSGQKIVPYSTTPHPMAYVVMILRYHFRNDNILLVSYLHYANIVLI